jgi:hypothetical protein
MLNVDGELAEEVQSFARSFTSSRGDALISSCFNYQHSSPALQLHLKASTQFLMMLRPLYLLNSRQSMLNLQLRLQNPKALLQATQLPPIFAIKTRRQLNDYSGKIHLEQCTQTLATAVERHG